MARGKFPFKQRDITRAVKAVSAAATVARVDIKPDGTISIITAESQADIPTDSVTEVNEWDSV